MEQEINSEKGSIDEKQIVVFKLGHEEFGVNIMDVKEIIRMEDITALPDVEEYIKGVINLRGGIIVIIDLAMKLGLPTKESDNNTRIIVVEIDNSYVGMIVDSATEVLYLKGEDVKSAPSIITRKIKASYLEGVGVIQDRLLILLNLAKVMGDTDIKKIAQGSAELSKEELDEAKQELQSNTDDIKEAKLEESVIPPEKVKSVQSVNSNNEKSLGKKTDKKSKPASPKKQETKVKKTSSVKKKSVSKSVTEKLKKTTTKKPVTKQVSKKVTSSKSKK